MRRSKIALVLAATVWVGGCDEQPEEREAGEQDLGVDEEATEDAKLEEADYEPTEFCLDNGSFPDGPYVGPAALGSTVLGTSGRADGFGNESWGAEYGAELSLRGVSGGAHGNETLIRGELVGRATVYDISADVVRIGLDGASSADGKTGFDANLTILDRFTYPLFSYEGNFSDEKHFSTPLFTATTGVPLVPGVAPVEVNASVVGSLGYLVSGQILPKGIAILVRPEASILVTATAHAGAAGIASARVEGSLELITVSVPIQAALTYDENEGLKFRWDVRVDMDADWLGGDIEVVASAFGQDRYRKSLAEFEGYHLSTTHLSNGAGEIFPGAPGDCGVSKLQAGGITPVDGWATPGPVDAAAGGSLDALLAAAPSVELQRDSRQDLWLHTALTEAVGVDEQQVARLADAIEGGDPASMVMLGALEQTGTPMARARLTELAETPQADPALRVRAYAALGRAGVPSSADIETLVAAVDREDGDIRTSAAYALGNALMQLRPYEPDRVAAVLDDLAARLQSTDDGSERILLLRVLGNVGADHTQDVVAGALRDEDPAVREAAAIALRHVPTEQADAWLAETMNHDDSVQVRAAAVRISAARDSEDAHQAVADLVQRERDDWVQFAALHALGRIVTRSDAAADALEWLAENGRLEQTRNVARNYLARLEAEIRD